MVSIILPTYNEKENISTLIDEIFRFLPDAEIIVVDDNSPDKTWKIVEDYNSPKVKLIRRTEVRGLATAIARGLKETGGDIIGWMDADMCMPPSLLPKMIAYLGEYDIAMGSRYIETGTDARSFLRVATSWTINRLAGLLLGFDIKDYDSGFILLKKYVFNKVVFPSSGYGDYFIEFIYKCKKKGFRIKETPYTFRDREKGESKSAANIFEFIKLGFGYFLRILKLRFSKI